MFFNALLYDGMNTNPAKYIFLSLLVCVLFHYQANGTKYFNCSKVCSELEVFLNIKKEKKRKTSKEIVSLLRRILTKLLKRPSILWFNTQNENITRYSSSRYDTLLPGEEWVDAAPPSTDEFMCKLGVGDGQEAWCFHYGVARKLGPTE